MPEPCPKCEKTFKSESGRTLHMKKCCPDQIKPKVPVWMVQFPENQIADTVVARVGEGKVSYRKEDIRTYVEIGFGTRCIDTLWIRLRLADDEQGHGNMLAIHLGDNNKWGSELLSWQRHYFKNEATHEQLIGTICAIAKRTLKAAAEMSQCMEDIQGFASGELSEDYMIRISDPNYDLSEDEEAMIELAESGRR